MLLHGTSGKTLKHFLTGHCLFCVRDTANLSLSSGLTTNEEYAKKAAIAAALRDGSPFAAVITITLPTNQVLYEGDIANHRGVQGFSSRIIANAEELTGSYLQRLGINKTEAIRLQQKGIVTFNKILPIAIKRFTKIG